MVGRFAASFSLEEEDSGASVGADAFAYGSCDEKVMGLVDASTEPKVVCYGEMFLHGGLDEGKGSGRSVHAQRPAAKVMFSRGREQKGRGGAAQDSTWLSMLLNIVHMNAVA
jgi:hypothetical protein